MNSAADDSALHERVAGLLAAAQRRLRRSAVRRAAADGFETALVALLCVSAAWWVVRLSAWLLARPNPIGWRWFAAIAITAVLLPFVVRLVQAAGKTPSLRECAERLDLASADHNRIATALALLECGDRSPFAIAAIEDGLAWLQRLADRAPMTDAVAMRPRRKAVLAAASVFMLLLGLLSGPAPTRAVVPDVDVQRGAEPYAHRRPTGPAEETPRPRPEPASRPALAGAAAGKTGRGDATTTRPSSQRRPEMTAGRAGGGSGAQAETSDRSDEASGESSEAEAGSTARQSRRPLAPRQRQRHDAHVRTGATEKRQEDNSSIHAGASGGGSVSAVQNTWSQKSETTESGRDEDDSEPAAEDDSESNTQRGGIQPSLKDRQAAPMRELGIPGEEGPPGGGRGGPTPPKKSRGTASLVLGVPVPDFVRGKLGPGATKVTRERVEPAPMPGEPPVPAEAAARREPESLVPHTGIPSGLATVVRNYLVALHSADLAPGGATVPSPQEQSSR